MSNIILDYNEDTFFDQQAVISTAEMHYQVSETGALEPRVTGVERGSSYYVAVPTRSFWDSPTGRWSDEPGEYAW